ncbi:hypothetical protein ACFWY6_14785 [Streptomyces sp. NPDC059037]|uniref:hypothetical protein n=1 Tax=Streptomyces sp. NPDC059037 TaxID=3346710 RepID=UPI0036B7B0A8
MTMPGLDIPPGPGFVSSVAAATGIHHTPAYDIAQLLITHPGPRRTNETTETVEDGMRRLAISLHLGPGAQTPPVIGPRILMWREAIALDYGHDQYVMTIPSPSQEWVQVIGNGALCRVCLVLTPIAITADQEATDKHLRECFSRGAVLWGTTYARRRFERIGT